MHDLTIGVGATALHSAHCRGITRPPRQTRQGGEVGDGRGDGRPAVCSSLILRLFAVVAVCRSSSARAWCRSTIAKSSCRSGTRCVLSARDILAPSAAECSCRRPVSRPHHAARLLCCPPFVCATRFPRFPVGCMSLTAGRAGVVPLDHAFLLPRSGRRSSRLRHHATRDIQPPHAMVVITRARRRGRGGSGGEGSERKQENQMEVACGWLHCAASLISFLSASALLLLCVHAGSGWRRLARTPTSRWSSC